MHAIGFTNGDSGFFFFKFASHLVLNVAGAQKCPRAIDQTLCDSHCTENVLVLKCGMDSAYKQLFVDVMDNIL